MPTSSHNVRTSARRHVLVAAIAGLAVVFGPLPSSIAAQAQTPPTSPQVAALNAAEAALISNGWLALAQGNLAEAGAVADKALADYPKSSSAVTLGVEVAIASAGAALAQDVYERWLQDRLVEHPYALRRVARSLLFETLASSSDSIARKEAAVALFDDGERDVARLLQLNVARGLGGDLLTLAVLGDPAAIDKAIEVIEVGAGDRVQAIEALAASRSERAVAPLIESLKSPRTEIRAAAAAGLGVLEAREAIPELQALLLDANLPPRMAAAASLYRLQDFSGYALLQQWYASEVGAIRLEAAKATLANPDQAWLEVVRGLTSDADPLVQIAAASLLSPYDPGTASATLRRLANDPNPAIQEAASKAMPAAIGGDFGMLRAYMRASEPVVRVRAAARLLRLTR